MESGVAEFPLSPAYCVPGGEVAPSFADTDAAASTRSGAAAAVGRASGKGKAAGLHVDRDDDGWDLFSWGEGVTPGRMMMIMISMMAQEGGGAGGGGGTAAGVVGDKRGVVWKGCWSARCSASFRLGGSEGEDSQIGQKLGEVRGSGS